MLEEVEYRLRRLARLVRVAMGVGLQIASNAFQTARVLEARGHQRYR